MQTPRELEPELQNPQEDIMFCKYKAMVGAGNDIALCKQNIIPNNFIISRGEGLQVLDLGGGDGLFARSLKTLLPKAKVITIDLSDQMKALAEQHNDDIIFVQDDLNNFEQYLDPSKSTLIVCRGTLHHLPDPQPFLNRLSRIPAHIGIFLKDLIRPKSLEQLKKRTQDVLRLAPGLYEQDTEFIRVIEQLTIQSLHAAFTEDEILHMTAQIEGLKMNFNKEQSYYELSKPIHIA